MGIFCLQPVLLVTVCQRDLGCTSQEFPPAHTEDPLPTSGFTMLKSALCQTGPVRELHAQIQTAAATQPKHYSLTSIFILLKKQNVQYIGRWL